MPPSEFDPEEKIATETLSRLMGNPRFTGQMVSAIHEEITRSQMGAISTVIKWVGTILSALLIVAIIAALSDHYSIKGALRTIDLDHGRVEVMWSEGGFYKQFPGK
jgi:hypothetical protein